MVAQKTKTYLWMGWEVNSLGREAKALNAGCVGSSLVHPFLTSVLVFMDFRCGPSPQRRDENGGVITEPDIREPHVFKVLLRGLRSISTSDPSPSGDWSTLTDFLACRAVVGNRISSLSLSGYPHMGVGAVESTKRVVGFFEDGGVTMKAALQRTSCYNHNFQRHGPWL
jgi:hypothetical protein